MDVSPLRRMFDEAAKPFDAQHHNCGSAVTAAYPALSPGFEAWPRNARDVLAAAEKAADRLGLRPAHGDEPAVGVADINGERLLAARINGLWYARSGTRGLATLPPYLIVASWSLPECRS